MDQLNTGSRVDYISQLLEVCVVKFHRSVPDWNAPMKSYDTRRDSRNHSNNRTITSDWGTSYRDDICTVSRDSAETWSPHDRSWIRRRRRRCASWHQWTTTSVRQRVAPWQHSQSHSTVDIACSWYRFLPRDAMQCRHAVSVRLSVRVFVTFVHSVNVKTNKHISNFLHRRVATTF